MSQAVDTLVRYFNENPDALGYFASVGVEGNPKVSYVQGVMMVNRFMATAQKQILQNVVAQGKKLGKAVYVFSVSVEGSKVAHANYVPEEVRAKGFDARTWASKVTDVLGGKVSLSAR